MRTVVVVLVCVGLAAVQGARAQSIPTATSAAFRQCQGGCDPLSARLAMDEDRPGSAGYEFIVTESTIADIAGPNRECVLCDALPARDERPSFGGMLPQTRPLVYAFVFDPAD